MGLGTQQETKYGLTGRSGKSGAWGLGFGAWDVHVARPGAWGLGLGIQDLGLGVLHLGLRI